MSGIAQPASLPTVLYVEDDRVSAIVMEAVFLNRPDLDLQIATDAAQGLRLAARMRPALLLLDLCLPDEHGTQLLARLRRLPGCAGVPAVAVTTEVGFVLRGSGFLEQWAKPVDVRRTLSRLEALLPPQPVPEPKRIPPPRLAPVPPQLKRRRGSSAAPRANPA